jgi:DNA helicase-2/ATP-dependent DNA helicase PcrA
MPPKSVVEDDMFPEDPEQAMSEVRKAGGVVDGGYNGNHRTKRPRLYGPAGDTSNGEEQPWRKDYATTMEQSSKFTVSSLPGFVSAASPQVALAAATASAKGKQAAQPVVKASTNKRPADQRSIMGFVKTAPNANPAPPVHSASNRQYLPPKLARAATTQPPKPAIEPELANHKLVATKMTRPVLSKRDEEDFKAKQYTCFSSSPTKPAAEEVRPAVGESAVSEENEPPPEPTRPAGSLHNTTCNMPKGLGGGFRRPAGLGREGIAPMDKLRKPFKPLTLNKP